MPSASGTHHPPSADHGSLEPGEVPEGRASPTRSTAPLTPAFTMSPHEQNNSRNTSERVKKSHPHTTRPSPTCDDPTTTFSSRKTTTSNNKITSSGNEITFSNSETSTSSSKARISQPEGSNDKSNADDVATGEPRDTDDQKQELNNQAAQKNGSENNDQQIVEQQKLADTLRDIEVREEALRNKEKASNEAFEVREKDFNVKKKGLKVKKKGLKVKKKGLKVKKKGLKVKKKDFGIKEKAFEVKEKAFGEDKKTLEYGQRALEDDNKILKVKQNVVDREKTRLEDLQEDLMDWQEETQEKQMVLYEAQHRGSIYAHELLPKQFLTGYEWDRAPTNSVRNRGLLHVGHLIWMPDIIYTASSRLREENNDGTLAKYLLHPFGSDLAIQAKFRGWVPVRLQKDRFSAVAVYTHGGKDLEDVSRWVKKGEIPVQRVEIDGGAQPEARKPGFIRIARLKNVGQLYIGKRVQEFSTSMPIAVYGNGDTCVIKEDLPEFVRLMIEDLQLSLSQIHPQPTILDSPQADVERKERESKMEDGDGSEVDPTQCALQAGDNSNAKAAGPTVVGGGKGRKICDEETDDEPARKRQLLEGTTSGKTGFSNAALHPLPFPVSQGVSLSEQGGSSDSSIVGDARGDALPPTDGNTNRRTLLTSRVGRASLGKCAGLDDARGRLENVAEDEDLEDHEDEEDHEGKKDYKGEDGNGGAEDIEMNG